MKINSFDRTNLKFIAADLKIALKTVEDKYGISLNYNGARFDANTATFKFQGAVSQVAPDGTVIKTSPHASQFNVYALSYGLKPDMLNKEITYVNGERFTIRGLNTRSHKFPVVGERVKDGKSFKLTIEGVKRAWNREYPSEAVVDFVPASPVIA